VQIESARAVEQVEEIAALDGVDVLFVAPRDLSHDLGVPGRLAAPRYLAAVDRVRAAAQRFGKGCGLLAPDGGEAAERHAQGWTFVAVGSDSTLLAAAVTAELARARETVAVIEDGEMGTVENDDYVAPLVRFAPGSRAAGAVGTLDASRVIVGPQCGLGFEIYGTDGSAIWNFEQMNDLRVCIGCGGPHHGYTTVLGNAHFGDYAHFLTEEPTGEGPAADVRTSAEYLRKVLRGTG
jgi:hypothetical protein